MIPIHKILPHPITYLYMTSLLQEVLLYKPLGNNMNTKSRYVLDKLTHELEHGTLLLPSLPEVAIKIRDGINKDQTSINEMLVLLSQDASIAANLIEISNRSLYRGFNKIDDLETAITRLGASMIKDLVTVLSVKQMFMTTSNNVDRHFRKIWATSVGTASICKVLASNIARMSSEKAMLCGLLHNIGALPILVYTEHANGEIKSSDIPELIGDLQTIIGEKILTAWNFSQDIIDSVSQCYDFTRKNNKKVDYVDLVHVALLHGGYAKAKEPIDINEVSAFKKLNINPKSQSFTMVNQPPPADDGQSAFL